MSENPYAPPTSELQGGNPMDPEYKDPKYRKVGGWLLFFCIVLTILTPLVNLLATLGLVTTYREVTERFPQMSIILVLEIILILGLVGFSIFAGIRLWTIHEKAVETAKLFLVVNFLGLVLISLLPMFGGLPAEATGTNMGSTIMRGLIFTAIWYSYLNKSVRVAQTYDLVQLI